MGNKHRALGRAAVPSALLVPDVVDGVTRLPLLDVIPGTPIQTDMTRALGR